ncbi:MAG: hypothetical protein WBF13_08195, partial [Candidatus Zixiibacteriota bacterium]
LHAQGPEDLEDYVGFQKDKHGSQIHADGGVCRPVRESGGYELRIASPSAHKERPQSRLRRD